MSYYPQQQAYVGPAPYRCSTAHVVISWVVTVGSGLYMLPWAVAASRNRPNVGAVALINLFLGWSVVGWVVALVMACGANPTPPSVTINQMHVYPPAPLPQPAQPWPAYDQTVLPRHDRPSGVSNDTLPLELGDGSYDPYPRQPQGQGSAFETTQPLPTTRPDGYPGGNPQQ